LGEADWLTERSAFAVLWTLSETGKECCRLPLAALMFN
jgi:hypothetical protein